MMHFQRWVLLINDSLNYRFVNKIHKIYTNSWKTYSSYVQLANTKHANLINPFLAEARNLEIRGFAKKILEISTRNMSYAVLPY